MNSLTSGILNLLGAFMLCYMGARMFCSSWAAILSSIISRGSGYAIKHRYSRFPFFHALAFAHFEQLPINVYVSILGYANSRAINLRQTVAALRGAMVGNILFLWIVALWLQHFSPTISNALSLSTAFLVIALFCFNLEKTRRGSWLLIGFALLSLGFSLVQLAASEIMIMNSSVVSEFMVYTTQGGVFSIILGALIGAIFSFIFRSPTMSVIVALTISGLYDQNIFLYGMAAGAPLGILFPLAGFAQRANATARRAMVLHSITVFGSTVLSIILCGMFYDLLGKYFIQLWIIVIIFTLTSLVFPSLVWKLVEPLCADMVNAIIPYDNVSHRLSILSQSVKMPPLFIVEIAKQEIVSHARRTYKMLTILLHSLSKTTTEAQYDYQQIDKYHAISLRVGGEITSYILQIGSLKTNSQTSSLVQLVLSQGYTLIEISKTITSMKETISQVMNSQHPLSRSQKEVLDDMFDHLQRCYVRTINEMTRSTKQTLNKEPQQINHPGFNMTATPEPDNEETEQTDSDLLRRKIALAAQKYYAYNQYQIMQVFEAVSELNQRLLDLSLLEKEIYNVNTKEHE